MKSNSKTLGDIIKAVDERNSDEKTKEDLGISINKEFMPSVANIIGTDLSKYKLLRKSRFAFNSMHTGRDERLPIALFKRDDIAIVSPAYFMFEIKSKDEVDEDYLMIWFQRPEFDHVCWYMTDASVRGGLSWDDFCRISIELPSIEEQRKIVHDYKVIIDRIELLRSINENLDSICKTEFKKMIKNSKCEKKLLCLLNNVVYGKGLLTTELTDEGYPVYGGNGIIGKYSKYLYDKRMVIISCRGAASGKVMYSEAFSFITSNSLVLEINNSKEYPFEFMLFSCYQTDFKSKVSGSAQPQLTVDNLKDVEINIPSNDNIQKFSKFANKCIEQICFNNKEIDNMEKLQTLILSKLSREVG